MGLKGETNSGTTGSWAWSRGEPDSGYIGRWAWVISRWDWTVSSSDPIVFCILSPLRHWCHLKDRSQRPPFVTVKFQFCAGWLRLFLQVKCLRFVSTKFRIWRLESSSLEKNLVDRFEKISVCVTDTHFKLFHKMPFYLSSPWMSELYWILSKVSIQSAEYFTTKETKQRHRRPKWILLLPTMSSGESSLYCKHLNVQRSNSLIKT